MPTITIYTRPNCGPCFATKRAFAAQGQIDFEEVNLNFCPNVAEELIEKGFQQAPVVIVRTGAHTESWSGYRPDRIKAVAHL